MHTIPPEISLILIGFSLGWCAKWACRWPRKARCELDWQPGVGDAFTVERLPGGFYTVMPTPPMSPGDNFINEHNAWVRSARPLFDDYKASGAGSWSEYLRGKR